jgi:hypothetical protein
MPSFRRVIPLLFLILFAVLIAACASAGGAEERDVMTGTVEFLDIEGGCWIIRTDDGRALSPSPLPARLRQNGLRVKFTASPDHGRITACMAGEPVTILSIEPLPQKNLK